MNSPTAGCSSTDTRTFPGIHCVLYALFRKDGTLDDRAQKRQVEYALAAEVDGITVLGLATEVQKLTTEERRTLIQWTIDEVAGSVPVSVTVSGNSVAEQVAMAQFASDAGADWLILQPPVAGNYSALEYVEFFSSVADQVSRPFAVQNAPQFLGRGLSADEITELMRRHPHFRHVKAESSATDFAGLVERCGASMQVLNGRGGLEMIDCLSTGCAGFIVAPEAIDHVVNINRSWQAGDHETATGQYATLLPAAIFAMQSIEHLICYGKRIFGERAGIAIHDRAPAMRANPAGLEMTRRWASWLGPAPGKLLP